MANYAELIASLDQTIKTNIRRLITGDVLNSQLKSMINELGTGYQYMGMATPETNPGTPDARVAYLASTPGTYPYFGNLTLENGKIAFFRYSGAWRKDEFEASSISTVDISVDDGTGTPSGTATLDGSTLTLAFSNLKGPQGDPGPQGNPGPQGRQGNSGYTGAAGELEVVNNWDDGGETAALSAEVGKDLHKEHEETAKLLNFDTDWQDVTLTFGRLGTGEGSFPTETSSALCLSAPILAKRGDVFKGYWNMRGRSNNGSAVYKTDSSNGTGISPLVQVATNGKQNLEFAIEEDCYITLQFNGTTISSDAWLKVKHAGTKEVPGNSLKSDPFLFQNDAGFHRILNWKNGSIANKASTAFIHCESYDIPAGVTKLIFKTTRPVDEGHEYRLSYRWLNASGSSISPTDSSADTEISHPISVPANAKRLYLSLRQYNVSAETSVNLRYTDMVGHESWICEYMPGSLAYMQDKSKNDNAENIVIQNKERRIMLAATSRQNKRTSSPYHDYQLLICTDEHNDTLSAERAIDAANGFSTINALVNCGDIMGTYFKASEVAAFQSRFAKLTKPGYVVVGNHDTGNTYYVGVCGTHKEMYESYIKPMVDAGYLAEGEYTENLPYWYHDNTTYKVRLIGLYEYDAPLDLANNAYWEPIPYDSTKPKMTFSTAYAVDDIVNCGNYTEYSFRCIQAVTTPVNYYTDHQKVPTYKCYRGKRLIREAQANWFLDTLASTPADYGVILLMHQPISNDVEYVTSKFTQTGLGATSVQSMMETDFIIEALTAFANGERYTKNIVMNNEAVYLNTQTSGGESYAYSVDKDFSQKNEGAYVLGSIAGHRHRDMVYKINGIYQIDAVCATTDRTSASGSDIRRTIDTEITRDSLTVASFAQNRIGLCKLGVNVTEKGTARDYEVIDTTSES